MKNITAFLAVADTKSFTKASEYIHLTQPAVTKRIANLESQFKTKLFERIGHRVVLTEAGQAFLPRARTIYTEWQNGLHQIANFSQTVCGTLTIGCNNHIATHQLPGLIKNYKNKFPEVDYNFIFRTSSEIIDLIINHNIDIGFISLPRETPNDIIVKKFCKNDMRVVLSPTHPFFRQKGTEITRLSQIPLIAPEKVNIYYDILNDIRHEYGIESKIISNINMLETIKKMVEAEIGWSIFPKHLIDQNLREISFVKKRFYADLVCIYHKKRELSKPAKEMVNCISAVFKI
ncbi:HTH-type transcriptional activator CmpR [Piscirickettsia salmonis]|uniref:HTH-type transcriptional activator CmpR n=1 Tax=Piscirickettsia salmonis TaxID=1238 RepID=A0A9Q6LIS6_PISSA|nr:LysR family transcriptional regulator [Piscirickettsia salmonis]QGO04535.1 HTH-type transcriptional activator CmpR [Piscirickettsia salmonis]